MRGGRAAWNAFIVAFLALQLGLPLRGLLTDKYQTRGDFSWNMYSQHYRCAVHYYQIPPGGTPRELDARSAFARPEKATHLLHRDVLPWFHAWLCREAARATGERVELRAHVECKLNDEPPAVLVDRSVDLCAAAGPGERP
jgi:hypothetical protein